MAICFHLAFDLIILFGLLSLSGGLSNPFSGLILLNVALGGVLAPGRLGWPFLLLAHALLGFMQIHLTSATAIQPSNSALASLASAHIVIFGTWWIMRALGRYLETQHEAKVRAQLNLVKHDRLRSVGAMVAGFSHEFSSPLNVAKIRIERAIRQMGPISELLEATKALEKCEKVIRQINTAQLDPREHQVSPIDLALLVQEVSRKWRTDHPSAELTIETEPAQVCHVSSVIFSQTLLNLLDNAWESNPSGQIRVSLQNDEFEFVLRIEDQGPGFSRDLLERKGEPFVTTKSHGTGLGLYLANNLAESLGGSLLIENLEERGARVTLRWTTGSKT